MADNIPFEMQIEIMKRLPVKSLAVFRSVSKAWKSVVDSRLFITDYTNCHQHHRLLICFTIAYKYNYEIEYVFTVDNDTLSQHTVANVPVSSETLVGTSHGLLCLEDGCWKKRAVIWNPSLGKSIAIDVPSKDYLESTVLDFGVHPDNFDSMIDLRSEDDLNYTVLGFGVRPDNFDPMIVLINGVGHPIPVLVFNLSSRIWRIPRGNLPPKSIRFSYDTTPVITDRCIYCKASERRINLVVGFDMVSEVFMEINLPNSVAHRSPDEDFSISMIRGSLALLECYDDAKKPVCDVWMMVEDGASKSFTKLFTINQPDGSIRTKVLGFRKNDQPIMETRTIDHYWPVSLALYEPRTGTIKKTEINVHDGSSFLSSYTETLLLLDQLDKQVVTIQLQ